MTVVSSIASNILSQGWMRDAHHASNFYRYQNGVDVGPYDFSPKAGWLYYVYFDINRSLTQNPNFQIDLGWLQKFYATNAVGLLAKQADLPSFKIATETVNQYNKKTKIMTRLDYEPLSITFHDDMANVTSDLWFNYFQYYFADGKRSLSIPYNGQQPLFVSDFDNSKYSLDHYQHGLNNAQGPRFFNSITIFLLNRQKYQSFTLVNPIISDWKHGQVDQTTGNKLLESKMTLQYEYVRYAKGEASTTGFNKAAGGSYYDNTPSPLSIFGGGSNSVFGVGGTIQGGMQIATAISKGNYALAAIGSANLAKNLANLDPKAVQAETLNFAVGASLNSTGLSIPTIPSLIAGTASAIGINIKTAPPLNQ
jgi:hypothetical protein